MRKMMLGIAVIGMLLCAGCDQSTETINQTSTVLIGDRAKEEAGENITIVPKGTQMRSIVFNRMRHETRSDIHNRIMGEVSGMMSDTGMQIDKIVTHTYYGFVRRAEVYYRVKSSNPE